MKHLAQGGRHVSMTGPLESSGVLTVEDGLARSAALGQHVNSPGQP